jgi:hypothetical protein
MAAYRILEWETGCGSLGLNGWLGHEVDGGNKVQRPDIPLEWNSYELLSGHVDSRIELAVERPVGVFGFMDGRCGHVPSAAVSFSIDGDVLGVLAGPGERTSEHRLEAGRHVLRITTPGDKTRRYPVWAIRELGCEDRAPFRIAIPTSNGYRTALGETLALLRRYWPDHPQVDVVHHEQAPEHPDVECFFAGLQSEVTWCEAMARYLTEGNRDEFVLLLLDDYGLCQPVDVKRVADAGTLMSEDLSIGAFFLTWMMLPSAQTYPMRDDIVIWPCWDYSIHTQAGLWRRASLLRALRQAGKMSIGYFEVCASVNFNERESAWERHVSFRLPAPANPSLALDWCDKTHWPIGYHNLCTRGKPDPRHERFLRDHGLAG